MSQVPPPEHDSRTGLLVRLWETISLLLQRALPVGLVAGRPFITGAERRGVLAWLRPLEAVARTLIILEAIELPPAPPAPFRKPRESDAEPRPRDDAALPPIARFRVLTGLGLGSGGGGGGAPPVPVAARLYSAWELAQRFEAVLDAVEDPSPHIRRVALFYRRDPGPPPPRPAGAGPPRVRRGLGPLAAALLAVEVDLWAGGGPAYDTS
jgi:hypothetical protein